MKEKIIDFWDKSNQSIKYTDVTFWKSITNWNLSILNNFFNSLNDDIKKDILVDLFGFNFTISNDFFNSFFRFITYLKKIRNSIVHNQKIYDILNNKRYSDLFEIYKIFYGKEAENLSTGKIKLEIIYKILNKIVYQDYDLRNTKIKNIFLEFNLNKKVNQKLYNNIYIDELLIRK